MRAEEMTKQHAGARYESNIARMAQCVSARQGSLKGKARKCKYIQYTMITRSIVILYIVQYGLFL